MVDDSSFLFLENLRLPCYSFISASDEAKVWWDMSGVLKLFSENRLLLEFNWYC